MPIYEYGCQACGHQFEKLIRNAGDLPKNCPSCGQPRLKKRFSTFAAKVAAPAGGCRNQEACPVAHSCRGGCCGGHG